MADTANLFLVGAPRAGTSSLFEYLSRHPAIFAPVEKEPHRFDDDVLDGRPGMPDDAYRAMYAAASGERWLLDASALYLYSRQALDAVAAVPGSQVVIALRNPVDLMASWHGLMVATGSEPRTSLDDALAAESAAGPFERRYSELARFARYVERWGERLGRDRVHVVLFEELTGPGGEVAGEGLIAALGLEPVALGPFPHLNTYRRPAPVSVTRSPAVRRLARVLLPAALRRQLWWTVNAALTPHGERPPVSPSLRARLELELESDVRRLGELLGRDLRSLWFSSSSAR